MKKFIFLLLAGIFVPNLVAAQNVNNQKEIKVMSLSRDSFGDFRFKNDVKVMSEYDASRKLWRVKLEEIFPKEDSLSRHTETYWLNLDKNCCPKKWELDKFKISGHNFSIFLLKKKSQR